MNQSGIVYLIGAGPGDPGLFTLRGAELLRQAEVVVYDGLVSRELLRLAPADAELIFGGKHDRNCAVSQEQLNAIILAQARAGRRVVRLKGGDPCVFGRGGEEAELLAAAGIPFEIVPGVSSVQSVACYAGIPVTHRRHSSQLVVVTGHEDPHSPANRQDWLGLARFSGTLVVLMGLKHLRAIADVLTAHGRPADTPAAVISQGTTLRQKTIVGTLSTIAYQVERAGLGAPAILVVGEVVRLRQDLNWFERRPLFGRRIVVTQRADLAAPLIAALRAEGAEVLPIPATIWGPHQARSPLDRALGRLAAYDWIVFSHPLAVNFFFERFLQLHSDWRQLGTARLGAYGPRTAAQLRRWRFLPAAVAADHKTPLILEAIVRAGDVRGKRFLLLRGEEADELVPEALAELGATVDVTPAFAVEPAMAPTLESSDFSERGANWIVFASGLAIQHFHLRFDLPRLAAAWPDMKLAIASGTIRWALDELGLEPSVTSLPDSIQAMVRDIRRAEESSPIRTGQGREDKKGSRAVAGALA